MSPDDYRSFDARGLVALLERREVSLAEIYEAAARVAAANSPLKALAWSDFDAALAAACARSATGVFRGLPTLLKDLNTFKTGWPATQGSVALSAGKASFTSYVVERLEAAGLVPAGQTTTPEFGLSLSCESPLWGNTLNPFDPSRTPGGSSGGAAAAVAAGVVPLAHATDSAGSIRIPAAHCGLFGLKPSRGRIPLGPDVGERMAGLTHCHVLTRSVRDSALALDVLHGGAPGDPYAAPSNGRSFLAACDGEPKGLRVALCPDDFDAGPVDPHCRHALQSVAALLAAGGAVVETAAPPIALDRLKAAMRTILVVNLAAALRRGKVERRKIQPLVREAEEMGQRTPASDYVDAVLSLHETGRILGRFFQACDLWITPMTAEPAPAVGAFTLDGTGFAAYFDRFFGFSPFAMVCSAAGIPAASVPVHRREPTLPLGVQLAAGMGGEATILGAAAFLEAAQPWMRCYPAAGRAVQ
ncbi:MAG: amidase [Parvibaculaceae bacterium]